MEALRDNKGLTEEEFLRQYNPDKYPKPALTADIIIFRTFDQPEREAEVLLIRRKGHPFLGFYALPGGFTNENEDLPDTARRELLEETGLAGDSLSLVGVYGRPGRDPRGWTVSAAYAASVRAEDVTARAGDDAAAVEWVAISRAEGMDLAFDHREILRDAIAVFQSGSLIR